MGDRRPGRASATLVRSGGPPERPDGTLRVRELRIVLPGPRGQAAVVDGVSFDVVQGRTTGLIGESGSGKSLTAMALVGLVPETAVVSGQVLLGDEDLVTAGRERIRQVRGAEISVVFQDPSSALNPTMTIGDQVGEILRSRGASKREARQRAVELLDHVGVPDAASRVAAYPHEFSGGMRQRAMIALALAGRPRFVLADEPTTALDVTVQARILDLLGRLRDEDDLALLLVSHDLRVMSHVADDLVVMYAGRICERGPAKAVLSRGLHPYTTALVRSVPSVRTRSAIADPLPGSPANPFDRPAGCPFNPRCPRAEDRCRTEVPELREIAPGRVSACHFAEELQ
ncbi:peptide/nickel transport system ATP-binding protein/oligopeptide transport system ATP-binding protein [Kribbella amoyensis]|uniref:Peptide/nickel transport system ATP-binding protein/oligopeptide transport system ATP-binding protein n=1 Tax=Kribbella amoyensis TaxID=996641 RepID=A0A561BST0_9ACTN|nr:ABC transporter ATP-binding protein [Kribbella amoyensis]TWD81960.1 peptide/nickel transport system ATP-binding protein/oligopeptide transport system ATP-binding protein [Kribbella amoyensis]